MTELDDKFVERLDKIRNAFMSPRAMIELNSADFDFAQQIISANSLLTDPSVEKKKEVIAISTLLDCSIAHAQKIKKAHQIIFQDAKIANREFKKNVVAQRFWELAREAKERKEDMQEAFFLKEYYTLLNLHKVEVEEPPRALPIPIFSTDPSVLEISSNSDE